MYDAGSLICVYYLPARTTETDKDLEGSDYWPEKPLSQLESFSVG
jgi:hypothetical protein